jgi:hypothetical protein
MGNRKRILTGGEKAEKVEKKEFMIIFINGKQKRIRRPPTIDGMHIDEFIRRNADQIFLHQNEMCDYTD